VFDVAADAYDRFMGRYSSPLAPALADLAGIDSGHRVLDVGCGPGALTSELVRRLGPHAVAAVDPSEPFVTAARERHPGVDVRRSPAEDLPFPDDAFDASLAQLVVPFMKDPIAGLAEMKRVTRANGVVVASAWDMAGERNPLATFWRAARELDPEVLGESDLAGVRSGHLVELFEKAGLRDVSQAELASAVTYNSFDDWWEPFTFGIGPSGSYARGLTDEHRAEIRERCRSLLGDPPITVTAVAWAARGLA
jgi:ubiquinone/menaquinone biosynthesis C-methylase UbiE